MASIRAHSLAAAGCILDDRHSGGLVPRLQECFICMKDTLYINSAQVGYMNCLRWKSPSAQLSILQVLIFFQKTYDPSPHTSIYTSVLLGFSCASFHAPTVSLSAIPAVLHGRRKPLHKHSRLNYL